MVHGGEDAEGEERGGAVPEDHQLTRSSNPQTARAEEAGRRRFRARTAAAGGEVVELDLTTGSVPARFARRGGRGRRGRAYGHLA